MRRTCIGPGDDQSVGVLASIHRRAQALFHLPSRHNLAAKLVPAFFRADLILQLYGAGTGGFEFAHGPSHTDQAAVADIRVGDQRHRRYCANIANALGGNQATAHLCGVPLATIRTATYAISGAGAALSGVIITSQVGLAVPYQGSGYELDVIAAVVVGGVALTGGTGSVLVGALGSIFIGVLLNGMALINMPAIWQMVIQGIVIILAVALYGVARSRTT